MCCKIGLGHLFGPHDSFRSALHTTGVEQHPGLHPRQVPVEPTGRDFVMGAVKQQALCPHSIPGFNGSEDCAALEQLLEGYDQQDQDQVSEVCNSPLFKYMDNDVSAVGGERLCLRLCS